MLGFLILLSIIVLVKAFVEFIRFCIDMEAVFCNIWHRKFDKDSIPEEYEPMSRKKIFQIFTNCFLWAILGTMAFFFLMSLNIFH